MYDFLGQKSPNTHNIHTTYLSHQAFALNRPKSCHTNKRHQVCIMSSFLSVNYVLNFRKNFKEHIKLVKFFINVKTEKNLNRTLLILLPVKTMPYKPTSSDLINFLLLKVKSVLNLIYITKQVSMTPCLVRVQIFVMSFGQKNIYLQSTLIAF